MRQSLLMGSIVLAGVLTAAGAAPVTNEEVVAVVQDFEGTGNWKPTTNAAVGKAAGVTTDIFAGGWGGFSLGIKEVPAAADSISFWVRTDDGNTAAMTIGLYMYRTNSTAATQAFGRPLWVTPTWQHYTIPFSTMYSVWNSAGDDKFHKDRVKTIMFQRFIVEGRGLRSAGVAFDQIEFVQGHDAMQIGRQDRPSPIVVDAAKTIGKVPRFWRALSPGDTVEHNAYFQGPDGIAMRIIGADRTFDYARITWSVFPKGHPWVKYTYGGPLYTEDASSNAVYDFQGMDALVENVRSCNMRLMMLILTVPKEMAVDLRSGQGKYYCCPPKDYDKWRSLVKTYVQHYADKYGKEEVLKWYWEIWNEPDLWWQTWKVNDKDAGAPEYMKMYDYAAAGITDVLGEKALLGGVANAGSPGYYSKLLLAHCTKGTNNATGQVGAPFNILTHHCYGNPFEQMLKLYSAKQVIDQYAPGKDVEIQVTEYASAIYGRDLGTRYQAASLLQTIDAFAYAGRVDNAKLSWLYWYGLMRAYGPTCDSYFIEPYPKAGMQITTLFLEVQKNVLAKPVYNAYRMLNYLDTTWLDVSGAYFGEKVHALATVSDDQRRVAVLVYNHNAADSLNKEKPEAVQLSVKNLPFPGQVKLAQYLIDPTHSDIYAAWETIGSPGYKVITADQVKQIKAHDALEPGAPETVVTMKKGQAWSAELVLAPNSAALFVFAAQ